MLFTLLLLKMKILVIVLNKGLKSGEYVKEVCRRLAQNGHRITIASTQTILVAGCKSITLSFSLPVIPVHEYLPGELKQKPVYKMAYKEAQRVIKAFIRTLRPRANKYDLIFAHHANITTIIAQRIGEEFNIPVVTMVHGTGLRRLNESDFTLQNDIKDSLLDSNKIIAPTEALATLVKTIIPELCNEKLSLIPYYEDETQIIPVLEDLFVLTKESYQPFKEKPFYHVLTERSMNILIISLAVLKKPSGYLKKGLLNIIERES